MSNSPSQLSPNAKKALDDIKDLILSLLNKGTEFKNDKDFRALWNAKFLRAKNAVNSLPPDDIKKMDAEYLEWKNTLPHP